MVPDRPKDAGLPPGVTFSGVTADDFEELAALRIAAMQTAEDEWDIYYLRTPQLNEPGVRRSMSPASFQLCRFNEAHAREMLSWRYPPPYEIYNSPDPASRAAIEHLLQGELPYLAVLDERGEMIAFRCFGPEAQVADGDYSEPALDMGGGLRPDLTGKGLGRHVIAAAMNYGLRRFSPRFFRTTVASFNLRAKKTCERLGYRLVRTFTRLSDGRLFEMMMQEARWTDLSIPLREEMNLKSRRATEEDFAFARAVHHSSYREWVVVQFGAWDNDLQNRFFRESWDRWPYDVIEMDGQPAGFCAVEHAHDATHVREFALHPEFQGRGIGAAYLRSLVHEFHSPQKPVRLRAFKANQEAISFYKRIGFVETGATDLQLLFEWQKSVVR